jgi:hypothetical protein
MSGGEVMGNDLRERLEALKTAAHCKKPIDDRVVWSRYHHQLQAWFESGDLVTRSEMEEAVAKERESCAKVACSIGDMHPDEDHSYHIGELIRARSEQKEGE